MCESMCESEKSKLADANDEFFNETLDNSADYKKLRLENEKFRQELYELHLKLDHNEAMQRELQELNESLEQLLAREKETANQNLQKTQEKYRDIEMDYEKRISHLKNELKIKMDLVEELQESVKKYKNLAAQQMSKQCNNPEDTIASLNKKIKELLINSEMDKQKQEENQEIIQDLNNQLAELQEILQVTRSQLSEKNEVLQNTREELALCRAEIETLKTVPTNELSKGNSLFAEVEDRRQMLMNKVTMYQNKYHEMKQAYNRALEEIQILKSEKAAAMKKCEECVVNIITDRNDLTKKYRSRIQELEEKLKLQLKTDKETLQVDELSFGYIESLLAEKKKEVEELQQKIENNSIEMLIQAEIKDKLMKQFRYWQYKAMSMEDQIAAIKGLLKIEFVNSPQYEKLCQILNEHKPIEEDIPESVREEFAETMRSTSLTTKTLEIHSTNYYTTEIEDSGNAKVKTNIDKTELQNWLDSSNMPEQKDSKAEKKSSQKTLQFTADTKDTSDSVLTKHKRPKEYPIMYISSKPTK